MKEKVNVKTNNEIKTREKAIGILAMWKAFWSPDSKELSVKETIMKDNDLSKKDKELLIKSLKNADCIVKPTSGGSSRNTTRLKVDSKQNEKHLKENPVHIDTKYRIDKESGKVIKTKKSEDGNEKIQEI